MSALGKKLCVTEQGPMWWCPACETAHAAFGWTFDGNVERPTFHPSFLSRSSRPEDLCHCFVRAGRIEYLSDSKHRLSGQTVDLPDWPYPEELSQ